MVPQHNPILSKWHSLSGSSFGRWLFGIAVGLKAPYTATIKPRIKVLEPGHIVIEMHDRRRVRNHLRSIHAAAMLNLTELTGGLMAEISAPADGRMIIRGVSAEFVKKARGTLVSEGRMPIPETAERADYEATVVIRDATGDEVANGVVKVLIGPRNVGT